jgi:hypothetical protein
MSFNIPLNNKWIWFDNRLIMSVPDEGSVQRVFSCRIIGSLWHSAGGCQVTIRTTLPWTIVRNSFGECHTTCKLLTSFVNIGKE